MLKRMILSKTRQHRFVFLSWSDFVHYGLINLELLYDLSNVQGTKIKFKMQIMSVIPSSLPRGRALITTMRYTNARNHSHQVYIYKQIYKVNGDHPILACHSHLSPVLSPHTAKISARHQRLVASDLSTNLTLCSPPSFTALKPIASIGDIACMRLPLNSAISSKTQSSTYPFVPFLTGCLKM